MEALKILGIIALVFAGIIIIAALIFMLIYLVNKNEQNRFKELLENKIIPLEEIQNFWNKTKFTKKLINLGYTLQDEFYNKVKYMVVDKQEEIISESTTFTLSKLDNHNGTIVYKCDRPLYLNTEIGDVLTLANKRKVFVKVKDN